MEKLSDPLIYSIYPLIIFVFCPPKKVCRDFQLSLLFATTEMKTAEQWNKLKT